jgi:hypothetical protein
MHEGDNPSFWDEFIKFTLFTLTALFIVVFLSKYRSTYLLRCRDPRGLTVHQQRARPRWIITQSVSTSTIYGNKLKREPEPFTKENHCIPCVYRYPEDLLAHAEFYQSCKIQVLNFCFFNLKRYSFMTRLSETTREDQGYPPHPLVCLKSDWMGLSFGWNRKSRGPLSQQVWSDKDPSLLKGHKRRA